MASWDTKTRTPEYLLYEGTIDMTNSSDTMDAVNVHGYYKPYGYVVTLGTGGTFTVAMRSGNTGVNWQTIGTTATGVATGGSRAIEPGAANQQNGLFIDFVYTEETAVTSGTATITLYMIKNR